MISLKCKIKTKLKAKRGGRSIRIEPVPEGTVRDLPREHREFCDITRESLTHATVATSAPDISVDAFVLRGDPL